jgi:Flavodoxin
MRAVVVYESMYGNTHLVAEAIGEGLGGPGCAVVLPVGKADRAMLAGADLVVVGGPTHAHGMSHGSTRQAAVDAASKPGSGLVVDPDAEGTDLRDWLADQEGSDTKAAAFDTRVDMAAALTGRASKGISRKLRHHGFDEIVEPESFLVTKETHLEPGEADRAREWGRRLATKLASVA